MITYLRFRDLQNRGVVKSWPVLKRWIQRHNFPPGRMAGPNTRLWTDVEVAEWLASRPVAGPPVRGIAAVRRAERLQRLAAEEAARSSESS